MKSTLISLLIAASIILPSPAIARIPDPSTDPAIGSYFFFAAVNRHCDGRSETRLAALDRYKVQFVTHMKKIQSSLNALIKEEHEREALRVALADLEKNGASEKDIAKFDSMLAKADPGEIQDICKNFAAQVGQWMQLQAMISSGMTPGAMPPPPPPAPPKDGKPPINFLSLQHVYAILKSCENTDPDKSRMKARAEAFSSLLTKAKTSNGLWRTFVDAKGAYKETHFPTATAMFNSPEFKVDYQRYLKMVDDSLPEAKQNDCAEFVSLTGGGGG